MSNTATGSQSAPLVSGSRIALLEGVEQRRSRGEIMNKNVVEGNWKEIKGKIKAKFGKFSDDDLESFNGNWEKMVGRIQKVYGYAQDRAEKEYKELRSSFGEAKMEPKNLKKKMN